MYYFNQWIILMIGLLIFFISSFIYATQTNSKNECILFCLSFLTFVVCVIMIVSPTGTPTRELVKNSWLSKNEYCIIAVIENENVIRSNDARFVNSPVEKIGIIKLVRRNGLGYVYNTEYSFSFVDDLPNRKVE